MNTVKREHTTERRSKKTGPSKKKRSCVKSGTTLDDGDDRAREWAQRVNPNVLMHVGRLAHYERPSSPFFKAPFWPRLRDSLGKLDAVSPSRKEPVDVSFVVEARSQWRRVGGAWSYLMHAAGHAHGETWAQEHARAKELHRFEPDVPDACWLIEFQNGNDTDFAWTPAHDLLAMLRDKVHPGHAEELGKPALQHAEFEEFWQRFVPVDLEDPASNLFNAGFVGGFVDGALGLSQQLAAKFKEKTSVRQAKPARKRSKGR